MLPLYATPPGKEGRGQVCVILDTLYYFHGLELVILEWKTLFAHIKGNVAQALSAWKCPGNIKKPY
jgi:hypothetical protein